ncbi:MAG: glycosyltransferase family 87 protein [Hyphomicrobiaceae bacterium]|nr:glycosyltransferase family 87 protein [Hyphomicrobiaceae bacterium]
MILTEPRRLFTLALVAGLLVALPLLAYNYLPARWPLDVADHAVGRDFVNLWVAGRLLLEGQWPALFDVQAYIAALHRLFHPALAPHFWSYPPSNFFIAVPLAVLPYGLALAVWTVAGLAAILWATRLGLAAEARRHATLLVLLAPATLTSVLCGQNGFFTGALVAGALLLLDRRPIAAGVLAGLLSLKPHLALVLMPALLALGAWRTILAAGATALVLALASVAAFGWGPWQAFLEATVPNQGAMLKAFSGFFTMMLVSPYAMLRHWGLAHGLAMGLQAIIAVAAIALVMVSVRRTQDASLRLGLVAAGTFVASPYALTYDLPVLAVALARLAARPQTRWTRGEAALVCAVLAMPLAAPVLSILHLPLVPLLTGALLLTLASPLVIRKKTIQNNGIKRIISVP